MSSILDALNKLEEEKKEAVRTAAESAIDPRIAARELVGRTSGRARHGQLSPVLWGLAGVGIFSLVVVSAAVGVYLLIRPSLESTSAAAIAPASPTVSVASANATPPVSGDPSASTEPTTAPAPSAPTSPAESAAAPAPSAPAPVKTVESGPKESPAERVAPAPKPIEVASNALPALPWVEQAATSTPPEESAAARTETAPPASVASVPLAPALPQLPVASAPAPTSVPATAMPSDISKLPMLRDSDKPRLGFEDVKINMVQPKSDSRPFARAIINLKPVVIGERISDTRTTLIGVEINGIAVEVNGSRERYFVPFGYSL